MSKNIALLIDNSGSMGPQPGGYNYIEYAKTDAATFTNIMRDGDCCAVIAFNTDASVSQPYTVLANRSVKDAVCRNILAIQPYGWTNVSDAIVKGNGQIGSAPGAKGMVLLTDGEWNRGVDPLTVLPNYPIYTIALGDSSGIPCMQAIAQRTNGTYHYAPGFRELQRVYNSIAQDAQIADTITNDLEPVDPYDCKQIVTPISPGIDSGKFTVNWDNKDIAYTPNNPVGNQINIFLTDPTGKQLPTQPVFVAPGGVVFDIPNPMPGDWTVWCWYAGQAGGRPLGCVWGGFEPYGTVKLELKTKNEARGIGEAGNVDIEFSDEGGPIEGAMIRVTLESPLTTLDEALRTNAEALNGISVEANREDGRSEVWMKIAAFELETGRRFIPVKRTPLIAAAQGNGMFRVNLPGVDIPGPSTLRVVAEGVSKRTGARVKRTRHLSLNTV